MSKRNSPKQPMNDGEYVYRPWITTKNGRRIYAKDCGLSAFKIPKRY